MVSIPSSKWCMFDRDEENWIHLNDMLPTRMQKQVWTAKKLFISYIASDEIDQRFVDEFLRELQQSHHQLEKVSKTNIELAKNHLDTGIDSIFSDVKIEFANIQYYNDDFCETEYFGLKEDIINNCSEVKDIGKRIKLLFAETERILLRKSSLLKFPEIFLTLKKGQIVDVSLSNHSRAKWAFFDIHPVVLLLSSEHRFFTQKMKLCLLTTLRNKIQNLNLRRMRNILLDYKIGRMSKEKRQDEDHGEGAKWIPSGIGASRTCAWSG